MLRRQLKNLIVIATSILFTLPAQANDIVVAPLYSSSVDLKTIGNVTALIASELDFMGGISSVIELDTRPSSLGPNCMKSTSCLAGITSSAKGTQLFTGIMSLSGSNYKLDMLLFDRSSNRIVRREEFTLAADAEAVANGMTPIIQAIMTGKSAEDKAEEAHSEDDFDFGDDDDFSFAGPSVAEQQREEAARRAAEEAKRREAEEARRREEERRRAEEEARRRAEEEARRRAEEEARRKAEEEARRRAEEERLAREREAVSEPSFDEMGDFDPSLISFGAATVSLEEDDEDDLPMEVFDLDEFEDEEEEFTPGLLDLDAGTSGRDRRQPNERTRTPSSSRETGRVERGGGDDEVQRPALRGRFGYTKYYAFDFIIANFDLALPLGQSGAYLTGSFNTFSVQRLLPEDFRQDGRTTEWNTIYPLGGGIIYKTKNRGTVRPYVGAELIAVQYYRDEVGADWAAGVRGRGGLDLMVSPTFGFNLEAHFGYWTGPTLNKIDSEIGNAGTLPGIVGGVSVGF